MTGVPYVARSVRLPVALALTAGVAWSVVVIAWTPRDTLGVVLEAVFHAAVWVYTAATIVTDVEVRPATVTVRTLLSCDVLPVAEVRFGRGYRLTGELRRAGRRWRWFVLWRRGRVRRAVEGGRRP